MKKKLKSDSPSNAAACSPSSGGEMECTLTRDKNGMLGILSAPPIFLCNRESVEDLIARHNELRYALKTLHETIAARMSADEPTPEDRLAVWSAWKLAGNTLSQENAEVCQPEGGKTL